MKTSELQGRALNHVLATIEGAKMLGLHGFVRDSYGNEVLFEPESDWAQGGPIMDEAEIDTYCHERNSPFGWHAEITGTKFKGRGPTRLIAAMRCYVASRIGDEVEIPEELK